MTLDSDRDKLLKIQKRIAELERNLDLLKAEEKMLLDNATLKLPFLPTAGRYNVRRSGVTVVYWNRDNKTYYCKPLYKLDGSLMGQKESFVKIEETKLQLIEKGYRQVV